jgi:hypothetical protein
MKRNVAIVLAILAFIISFQSLTHAQEADKKKTEKIWRRMSVSGYLGFQFGSVASIIVTPEIKMRIFDQLYGGLGFTYEYNHFKNYYIDTRTNEFLNFNLNIYGGRIFLRYYLASIFSNFLGNIFAHVEYEYLTYNRPYIYDPKNGYIQDPYNNRFVPGKQIIEVSSLFVGAGYKQPIGGRTYIDLLILFNLNDTYYSPYSNPLFRLGFGYQL